MRNKKGFTLAEILIALGIISVMGAIMITSLSHARPDKVKMMYLKAYDSLLTAVSIMVNDGGLFSSVYKTTTSSDTYTYNIANVPFLDTDSPTDSNFSAAGSGPLKFAKMLQIAFKGTYVSKTSNSYTFRSGPGNYLWSVTYSGTPLTKNNTGNYTVSFCNQVELQIDDPSNTFRFCVQPNGAVQILDNRGQTFVNNRKNPRSVNDTPGVASTNACSIDASLATTTIVPTITPGPSIPPTPPPSQNTIIKNGGELAE